MTKVPVRSPQPSLAGGTHGAGHPSDLPGVPPTATNLVDLRLDTIEANDQQRTAAAFLMENTGNQPDRLLALRWRSIAAQRAATRQRMTVPPTVSPQGSIRRLTSPAGDGADTPADRVCVCAESTTGCAPSLAAPTHPVDSTPAAETSPSAAGGSGQDPR